MELRNSLSVQSRSFGSVKVFPNPASKVVYLTMDLPVAKTCNISIASMNGKTLVSQIIHTQAAWNACSIPVNDIPSGIYLIQIRSGKESLTHKLVID